jgi:hypothetical protein
MEESPLRQLRSGALPKMVSWYDPRLLARIGVRTIISSTFGQYADQRLIQAVTDPAEGEALIARYDYRDPKADDPLKRIEVDDKGAYWIDYIADTGDGFDSTYAMAYVLAQDSLDVADAGRLKHGHILIAGGDQCYPQATREDYKKRFVTPLTWAFNVAQPSRKLFAIPGNHDWYDGLTAFDSLFCSSRDKLANEQGLAIGGWQCQQHRSYWALRLPHNWWIWGTDIQFSKYLDSAQINYFEAVAEQMGPEDKLIICMAEPAWMLADFQGQDEEQNFFKITTIARRRGARICAALAGDWHHYNRYYAHQLDVHFFTAGGGGSFLHPTHVLKNEISVAWPERSTTSGPAIDERDEKSARHWKPQDYDIRLKKKDGKDNIVEEVVKEVLEPLNQPVGKPPRARKPIKPQAPKCYPSKSRSYLLSLLNLFFPFYNFYFAVGIGLIYWLITWQFFTVTSQHDISAGKLDAIGVTAPFWGTVRFMPLYIIQAALVSISFVMMVGGLWATLVWYVDAIERPGLRRALTKFFVGTAHFLTHLTVMFMLALSFVVLNNWVSPAIETEVSQLWRTRNSQPAIVRDVLTETLEPLSDERREQRGTLQRKGAPGVPAGSEQRAQGGQVRQLLGFVLYPLEMIVMGGLIGGFLWGLYWVVTGVVGRMHAEDAFAALRIIDYKNFLRMKFEPDKLTIYPLGIDKVPREDQWVEAPKVGTPLPHNPAFVPARPMIVRLIEAPIIIHASETDF